MKDETQMWWYMIIYQEIYHIDFVTKLQSCRYYQDMIKNDNI